MGVIQEFFNNREIAIGIWVIIGLAVILPTKPARQFIKTEKSSGDSPSYTTDRGVE